MQLYEVILVGIALSIDACAVTIANCTTYKCSLTKAKEWSMPIAFAFFQGLMPLIGYFIGSIFASYIASVTKFITAGIFLFLAVKIIIDIGKENCETAEKNTTEKANFTLVVIILQAIATSIDALAVGVTMIDIKFSIVLAITVIASVTFLFVSLALIFGKTLGKLFGKYAEWVGALILLILSIKSLIEAFL